MGDGKISMGEHVAGLGDRPLRGGRDLHRGAAHRDGALRARLRQLRRRQGSPGGPEGRTRPHGASRAAEEEAYRSWWRKPVAEKTYLFRSSAGVDHWMLADGNETRFASTQDVAPMLEQNKQMATHNDGYTPPRTAPGGLDPLRRRPEVAERGGLVVHGRQQGP
jgi:hypothetical protein